VKYALNSADGVSEVASIGGFVQEYQIDVDPNILKEYNISLEQVVDAVRMTNRDIGAKTIEINKVEYLVRGLGYVKSLEDLESTVVTSEGLTSVLLKDVATVNLGPAERRGILDKEGAEVVGGVVVARYGANPLEVITKVKERINEISSGLPSKTLEDGRISQLTIVPFYDRTELIQETLTTLSDALSMEILITILVIVLMLFNLRASVLISGLLPAAVLMVFIFMKIFSVDANIVALSGIAIAIGTMVDVGGILSENIIRHIEIHKRDKPINKIVYQATKEVSSAIITAVMTTIVSFIPVFTLIGAEGKLFRPLAFTKTMALTSSLILALFIIPPFAAWLFGWRNTGRIWRFIFAGLTATAGLIGIFNGFYLGGILVVFAVISILRTMGKISEVTKKKLNIVVSVITIVILLSVFWRPLGLNYSIASNLLFVGLVCFGLLGLFVLFRRNYVRILNWALDNKIVFLSIPTVIVISGFLIMSRTGKEFMPALNEGSFLLMPTSMPHSGVSENKRVLQQLDMAVASIPEIKTVVGKAGRVESALDPAPLSMYENVIIYRSEYVQDEQGKRLKFKTDKEGRFETVEGEFIKDGSWEDIFEFNWNHSNIGDHLIQDRRGSYFRQWRSHIKSPDDIWNEIVKVTNLPGVTSAPKLQPIQTRLVMLQTGMRAPMGIKIMGQDLKEIETFGIELEHLIKEVPGVKEEAVFADRIIGKPYLMIDIDRKSLERYGITIEKVQSILEVALGGKMISKTVEGRERYGVRVRYPRELRTHPEDIRNIYVPTATGDPIPLMELVSINYEQGPQVIKSENTFLVGYVLFDKLDDEAEVTLVEKVQKRIKDEIDSGGLVVPKGINYQFTGTYENQLRAERTLSFVVPLVLLVIFIILYLQFRSVLTSLMVFVGIAVAFAGGFIMIWLYGESWFLNFDLFGINFRELLNINPINLSVAVWVGFIALFGIATDDGVIMATYLKQSFEKNRPKSLIEVRRSIVEAGEKRIRPCLMTTATTLLALLPILTSTGRGSDIMIPMAIPSFGGMLIALITLFVVPVLYSWKEEISLKISQDENQ
jgi:Cu(I)/Ag(I) efflux system membrane protein CusA/SilA